MKYLGKNFFYIVTVISLTIFTQCSDDKDDARSVTEEQMEKLTGTWKATSVKVDETIQDGFGDFTLTISPATGTKLSYLITNNPYATPWTSVSTGNFTFDDGEPLHYLIREDGVSILYTVTDRIMTLSFTYDETSGGGRTAGVGGVWEFSFEKTETN